MSFARYPGEPLGPVRQKAQGCVRSLAHENVSGFVNLEGVRTAAKDASRLALQKLLNLSGPADLIRCHQSEFAGLHHVDRPVGNLHVFCVMNPPVCGQIVCRIPAGQRDRLALGAEGKDHVSQAAHKQRAGLWVKARFIAIFDANSP